MVKYCPKCGNPMNDTAKFCRHCGMVKIPSANTDIFAAPGEFDLGAFGNIENVTKAVRDVKDAGKRFRTMPAILSAIGLSILWIVQLVWIKNDVSNPLAVFSEWLTFARGGIERSFFGGIGGLIGKGVVASALAGIVGGGMGSVVAGVKQSFNGAYFKKNTGGFAVTGIGISFVLYQIFTGNGSFAGAMAAVASMLVAARASVGKAGILYGFARKITSKKQGKEKIIRNEAVMSMLGGITMGSAFCVPIAIFPWETMHVFLGIILIVIGLIMTLASKSSGKTAGMIILFVSGFLSFSAHNVSAEEVSRIQMKMVTPSLGMEVTTYEGKETIYEPPYNCTFVLYSDGTADIEFEGINEEFDYTHKHLRIGEDQRFGPANGHFSKHISGFSFKKVPWKNLNDGEHYGYGWDEESDSFVWSFDGDTFDVYSLRWSIYNLGSHNLLTIGLYGDPNGATAYGNAAVFHDVLDADRTFINICFSDDGLCTLADITADQAEEPKEEQKPEEPEKKKNVEIVTEAKETEGEDEVEVDKEIIEGREKEEKKGPIGAGTVAVVGAGGIIAGAAGATAAGAAAKGDKGSQKGNEEPAEEQKKKYKMKVYKDFGNTISKGQQKYVYARIVEVDPKTGMETDRPDLTMNISISCDDGSFDIGMQEELAGNYKGAQVSVADDFKANEGYISFKYSGVGGTFTNRMRFNVTTAEIVFDQSNISIPHDYDKPLKPYFIALGFGEGLKVTASILPDNAYNVNVTEGESTGLDFAKLFYANLIPLSGVPSMDDREPGASEMYSLHIEAVDSSGTWAEANLPIARIRTGLILTAKYINCFFNKDVTSAVAIAGDVRRHHVRYTSLAETKAELKLVVWDDSPEEHRVKILAPLPKSIRFKTEDPEEQTMIDKMAIQMDPGDDPAFGEDGGLQVALRVTKAWLDAPRRIKAKVTVEAVADNKTYSAEQDILLVSQPNRNELDMEQMQAAIKEDERIEEQLEHLKQVIHNTCYQNLFPVHKIIDEMLLSYDPEYGYDEENVATVINTYNSFCRGEMLGANAKPAEGESVIDWMLWAIDAMGDAADRLEEKAGFWTRLAIGVATAGLSEVAFTTMDIIRVPYRMKQAIEKGEDTVIGVMWAGAKDIVLGEIQGRGMEWLQGGAWTMAKGFAAEANSTVGKKLFNIMTKSETAIANYSNKVQSINAKTTINKEMFSNVFKPDVNVQAAKQRAQEATLSQKQADLEADRIIKEQRMKDVKTELGEGGGATEHGVIVETLPDGSQKVVGRDLSDPWTKKSLEGYEKVVELHRATENLRNSPTPEAQLRYDKAAAEVRSDFVAGDHLKHYSNVYAKEVQYKYNQHWEGIDARADKIAGDNLYSRLKSENPGLKREDIYTRSVTTSKKDPYKTSIDHDMTDMMKKGPGKADVEINDRIQYEENAKAAYEAVTGKKPASLEEAIRVAEKYQYTTVAGEGTYAKEKFADVKEMLDPGHAGNKLKNALKDAEVMEFKTKEFVDRAHAGSDAVESAMNLFEAGRTTHKDMARSIISRNEALMMKGHPNALTKEDQILCVLLDRTFGKGARAGHLSMDCSDFYRSMKAVGIENGTQLAAKMKELTLRVSGGD